MLAFLGLHDKKRLEKFYFALQQDMENIAEIIREENIETHEKLQVGCESCGSKDAAMVESGTFYCVGFYPFIGAYGWSPKRSIDVFQLIFKTKRRKFLVSFLIAYFAVYFVARLTDMVFLDHKNGLVVWSGPIKHVSVLYYPVFSVNILIEKKLVSCGSANNQTGNMLINYGDSYVYHIY